MSIATLIQEVKDEVAKLEAGAVTEFDTLKAKLEALFSHPVVAAVAPAQEAASTAAAAPAAAVVEPVAAAATIIAPATVLTPATAAPTTYTDAGGNVWTLPVGFVIPADFESFYGPFNAPTGYASKTSPMNAI